MKRAWWGSSEDIVLDNMKLVYVSKGKMYDFEETVKIFKVMYLT